MLVGARDGLPHHGDEPDSVSQFDDSGVIDIGVDVEAGEHALVGEAADRLARPVHRAGSIGAHRLGD